MNKTKFRRYFFEGNPLVLRTGDVILEKNQQDTTTCT